MPKSPKVRKESRKGEREGTNPFTKGSRRRKSKQGNG
jgi:hypothetical protein